MILTKSGRGGGTAESNNITITAVASVRLSAESRIFIIPEGFIHFQ